MTEKKNAAPVYQTGNGTESNARLSSTAIIPQNSADGKQDPGSQNGTCYTIRQLKEQPIWLCWRKKRTPDGRVTKVPVSPYGGATGTDEAHRSTWADYETARAAARKNSWDGVGFVIPEGYAFLDLDGMPPEHPTTQTLMALLPSYAERSVSGNGTHIYMRCDLHSLPVTTDERGKRRLDSRYYTKNSKEGIELYIGGLTNRYAVFTGDAAAELPLTDCTEGLQTVLDSYMLKPAAPSRGPTPARRGGAAEYVTYGEFKLCAPEDLDMTALNIIQKLENQKNAEKFKKLFYEGDTSMHCDRGQNEADQALCCMIAFRTGPDPGLIDAVFRHSSLYRSDKWERDDYRNNTIRKAIDFQEGIFHRETGVYPPFIILTGKDARPTVSPALLAAYIRERVHYLLVHADERQTTQFYVYQDGVYRPVSKERMLGFIKKPVNRYDPSLVKMPVINETYQQLITDLDSVSQRELNADETLINFRNGLLRVTADKLTLLPHSPDVYSTIQLTCDWRGQKTPTPVFDSFLHTLSDGEEEKAELLLQYAGVAISNVKGYRTKKSLFHVGPGDTGKSQFKALVENLLGEGNYAAIDLQQMESRFGTSVLYQSRMAGSSDLSALSIPELKTFKNITGGDAIFCEFKGQQPFPYVYHGVLWFCMNRMPKFGGDNGKWVYDRIMIVESHTVIPKDRQDKQLLDKMLREKEGIAWQMVKALQNVLRNGYRYSETAAVAAAREQYLMENSSPIGFFESCMCPRRKNDFSDGCTVSVVFDAYRSWCQINHHGYFKAPREFRTAIAEHLGKPYAELVTHKETGNSYTDYTLTEEAAEEFIGLTMHPAVQPAPKATEG